MNHQTSNAPDPAILAEVDIDPSTTLSRAEDRWVLGMTRDLRHDPARVWRMLTQPDQLLRWSPVGPDRPLTSVGRATSVENPGDEPVDAEVLVADEPRELVHRWGSSLLRWTLTPHDGGTRLDLSHFFDDERRFPDYAAGWRICLAALAASYVHGDEDFDRVCGPRSVDYGWQRLRDAYATRLS